MGGSVVECSGGEETDSSRLMFDKMPLIQNASSSHISPSVDSLKTSSKKKKKSTPVEVIKSIQKYSSLLSSPAAPESPPVKPGGILREPRFQVDQNTIEKLRDPEALQDLIFNSDGDDDDSDEDSGSGSSESSESYVATDDSDDGDSTEGSAVPSGLSKSKRSTQNKKNNTKQQKGSTESQESESSKKRKKKRSTAGESSTRLKIGKKKKSLSAATGCKKKKPNPGDITCAICSVVKFYSHRQRRFGQFSCESCSKFFGNFLRNPSVFLCQNMGWFLYSKLNTP